MVKHEEAEVLVPSIFEAGMRLRSGYTNVYQELGQVAYGYVHDTSAGAYTLRGAKNCKYCIRIKMKPAYANTIAK